MDRGGTGQSIEELAAQTGVPVRTIRFYITRGLLPSPSARGKAASYGDDHLLRLRLIRRLADQRVPLEEIRQRLVGLSMEEVRTLLAEEERRTVTLAQAQDSPREYVAALLERVHAARQGESAAALAPSPPPARQGRVVERSRLPSYRFPGRAEEPLPGSADHRSAQAWRRWELAPGVELHVRADAEGQQRHLIERLLAKASHQER